jgi:hypothetical protein
LEIIKVGIFKVFRVQFVVHPPAGDNKSWYFASFIIGVRQSVGTVIF